MNSLLKTQKLKKILTLCLFLINLSSCYQSKKIISNYCYIYTPLNVNLNKDIVKYWKDIQNSIDKKNENATVKTINERFIEILIESISTNDITYYKNNCENI